MNNHRKRLENIQRMPMRQETLSDAFLRKFLLGKVRDQERDHLEKLFLIDSEVKQRVLNAEQDLIEDYLEDSLTPEDRTIFRSVYVRTAKQRQSLLLTKSIKKWAIAEGASLDGVAANNCAVSGNHLRWLPVRPILLATVAVTIVIALIIAIAWLNRTRQKLLAIEQELAQLNTPVSLRNVSGQMVSLEVPPVTLRSAKHRIELKTSAGVQLVELRLPWLQEERFSVCDAEIRRVGDDESFTIRNVRPEPEGHYVIRIRLPAHVLHPGQYQIRLRGIAANGAKGLLEEYQFTVGG